MYKGIKILSPDVAAKIAAGEVIERPAQAVKELVENSIDAGSTDISVEIEKGGKFLIKVVDNGTGIRQDEVKLAFSRHATSKISSISDLEHIATLGFRGEALASLASCSRIEIITRAEGEAIAKIMKIEGGEIKYTGETARGIGTTLIAKDLFYNLPARRKFLKSVSTEAGHIIDILSQMALANTHIRFSLIMDGNTSFDLPQNLSFERRVGELYGRELEKEFTRLRGEKDGMKLSGGILPPTITRANRGLQVFIVNNRPVRSPLLGHALYTAFQSLLPSGRFPIGFIILDVPAEEVDVNIHPTKREIKFEKERDVHAFIVAGIRLAFQNIRLDENMVSEGREIKASVPETHHYAPFTTSQNNIHTVREEVEEYLDEIMGPINLIGQVKDTYIIMEKGDGMELIDQHAAHERILYEQLKKELSKGHIQRQALLFPLTVEMGLKEALFLKERLGWFLELGIEIEEFGKNIFTVRALPPNVKNEKAKEFISGLIEELAQVSEQKGILDLRDEALKVMACRGAVMAGDKLTGEERLSLIRDLNRCQGNMTCPHGRPIRVLIPWQEIEKRFKR